MTIETVIYLSYQWSSKATPETSVHWRGSAFIEQQQVDFQSLLLMALKEAGPPVEFSAQCEKLSGFYACVASTADALVAVVDPVRSIPLFYTLSQGKVWISDNAEWLREQVQAGSMDPIARDEFLLTGYVTGSDTLYAGIKQLQAGEMLFATGQDDSIKLELVRYVVFRHIEPSDWVAANLADSFTVALIASFERLISYAGDRQIVVPLSGGYDSRLVASILKKLNAQNVLCFSYGRFGNTEALISKRVAEALGFRWQFVEYTDEDWRTEWSSPLAAPYRLEASGHTSLPHPQDWLACRILAREGLCDSNAVMVPGHTGDFISGGHIPAEAFRADSAHDLPAVLMAIAEHHYNNGPWSATTHLRPVLHARIASRITGLIDPDSGEEFANACEAWEWQERQAKYICNSVRVYEFFGFDWWLPLWDMEVMRFWMACPLALRKGRHFYIECVHALFRAASGNAEYTYPVASAGENTYGRRLARKLLAVFPWAIQQRFRGFRLAWSIERSHFLNFGGLIPEDTGPRMARRGWNRVGMFAFLHLEGTWDQSHPHVSAPHSAAPSIPKRSS